MTTLSHRIGIARFTRTLLLAFISLGAVTAQAQGTLSFKELEPLLKQQPATRAWMMESLKLPDSAVAEVRLGNHFVNLGGKRVGPYYFEAQSKTGKSVLWIGLCTQRVFQDKAGKILPEDKETQAVKVTENLVSVLVADKPAKGEPPRCP